MGLFGNLFTFMNYRNVRIDNCTLHCRKENGYLVIEGIFTDSHDDTISIPDRINRVPVTLNLNLQQYPFTCHSLILTQGIEYLKASSTLDIDEVHLPASIKLEDDDFLQLFNQTRTAVHIAEGHQTYSNLPTDEPIPAVVSAEKRLVYQVFDDSNEWTIPEGVKDISIPLLQTRKDISTLNIPSSYGFIVGGIVYTHANIQALLDSFHHLKVLSLSQDNPYYGFEDNILYARDTGTAILAWLENKQNLKLPEGIRGIDSDFIDYIKDMKTLTLPSSYEFLVDERDSTPNEISHFMNCFHNLEELIIAEDNSRYSCEDGILYDNLLDTVIWEDIHADKYLYLPDETKNITSNIVNNREDVESLRIPSNYFFSIDGSICEHDQIVEFIKSFPNLNNVFIDDANPVYAWESNVLYNKVTGVGIYAKPDAENSLTIPEGVRYMNLELIKEVTDTLRFPASFEYDLPDSSEDDPLDKKAYRYICKTPCRYYTLTNSSRLRDENGFLIDCRRHSASGFFNGEVENIVFPDDVHSFSIMNTRNKEKTRSIVFPPDFNFLSFGDDSKEFTEGLIDFLKEYPKLENVTISDDNDFLFIMDNLLIDKMENKVIYIIDKTVSSIEIPEGINSINADEFNYVLNLESVTFPDSFDFTALYTSVEDSTQKLMDFFDNFWKEIEINIPENPVIKKRGSCFLSKITGDVVRIIIDDILEIPEDTINLNLDIFEPSEFIDELIIPRSLETLVDHEPYKNKSNEERAWIYASSEAELLGYFYELKCITVNERNEHYRYKNNSLVRKFTFKNGDVFHAYLKIGDPENAIIRIPDANTFIACKTEETPLKRIVFDSSEGLVSRLIENREYYNAKEILIPVKGFNEMYEKFSKQMMEMNIKPYDAFGIVPMKYYGELPYRQSGRYLGPDHFMMDEYEDLNPNDEVRIHISKIIVVLQTFPCISKHHDMIPVKAIIGVRRSYDSVPKELKIPCYYCRDCNRFFIYKEIYINKIKPLIESTGTEVFNLFFYNGVYRGYDYAARSAFKETSILKDAGYEVNALSHLTEKARLDILTFLWESGVESHVIISYIDNFIHFNGGVRNRDMSLAIAKWRNDLSNFDDYISAHRRQRYIKPTSKPYH